MFQPELRSLLEKLGRVKIANVNPFSKTGHTERDRVNVGIEAVCETCAELSRNRIGGLMVFEKTTKLGDIAATGTYLNSELSAQMLVTIFFPKTPLHDGAVMIEDFKIVSAGCLLPLSQRLEISKALGTRHRAAVGMSEISDAVIVVVSEETGKISYAQNGEIHLGITVADLRKVLEENFRSEEKEGLKWRWRKA